MTYVRPPVRGVVRNVMDQCGRLCNAPFWAVGQCGRVGSRSVAYARATLRGEPPVKKRTCAISPPQAAAPRAGASRRFTDYVSRKDLAS